MTASSIEFCRSGDLPELFERFADWYRFNPRMREQTYFDWQFRDAPHRLGKGEYDFLILRGREGRINGCLGFVGMEFRQAGATAIGGWTHNWYAEGSRDGGLALLGRFMDLVDNRFLLRLNAESSRITDLLRIPRLPAIPRWWAALQPDRVINLFGFDDAADQRAIRESAHALEGHRGTPLGQRVQRVDAAEEFLPDRLGPVLGHVRRTGRYVNWRYVDIPKHEYRILRNERAFAVYRLETVMGSDVGIVRVLEWTFGCDEAAGALAAILADVAGRTPVLIDVHCTHLATGAMFESLGFRSQAATSKPMPDLFRPTHRSGGYTVAIDLPPHRTSRSVHFGSWYITIGDSDIDRVKL